MLVLGLTGSIGMGKSTAAAMFRACGVPVWDADATVHELYRGDAVGPLGEVFPDAVANGMVDRKRLADCLVGRPDALKAVEGIVHPLVDAHRIAFTGRMARQGRRSVVLDVPLLFETGGDARVHAVVVVTADRAVQEERVLARPGMTRQKLSALLERQLPDCEKRRRAHFVVDSGLGFARGRRQIEDIVRVTTYMC